MTGSTTGSSQRPLTVAIDVVSGQRLSREGGADLSRALDGAVPGVWIWEQSPASLLARYASIRGASSFGATYPKIYIDGIEVANPLLITQFDPESIDHVEVIRGPQGAALYGSDAISGVVNIVTRHDGVDSGAPHSSLRSSGGVSSSSFAPQAVLAQNHSLALAVGSSARSAQLDLGYGTLGAFYPGASSERVQALGGLRLIGSRTVVTATARLFVGKVGASVNPLLTESTPTAYEAGSQTSSNGAAAPQSVEQYTVGATVKFAASDRWTHSLVAGVDGYRLTNVSNELTPFPSSTDSALRAARGSADRTTLRVSSVAKFGSAQGSAATFTLAAEHSALRAATPVIQFGYENQHGRDEHGSETGGVTPGAAAAAVASTEWLTSAGLISQADLSFRNALFFTIGGRLERSDAYAGAPRVSVLPMLGSAAVRTFGELTVKLRAAYGKGIRAPWTAPRETVLGGLGSRSVAADLAPEEQSGVEGGVDLFVGRLLTLQFTAFDQLASGLIQQVAIPDTSAQRGGGPPTRLGFQYQNVGAITNRGLELQATTQLGPVSLSTAGAVVRSRVRTLATGYTGDLRAGDRMLDVPAATLSFSAGWTGATWSATLTASRATDWIDYDRLALARSYLKFDRRAVPLVGADLRGYWRTYDGSTHLRASITRQFSRGLSLVVTGENLLGAQRGEPDNVTILPGRTVTTGLRATFF